jgi:hypothetical protein
MPKALFGAYGICTECPYFADCPFRLKRFLLQPLTYVDTLHGGATS